MLSLRGTALAGAFSVLLLGPGLAQATKPSRPKTPDMTFTALDVSKLCADCIVVQASGTIGKDTIKAYNDFVWREGRIRKHAFFVFDSPGGSMQAAARMGEIMRTLNVNTLVGRAILRDGAVEIEPGRCLSSCVVTYLGGRTRSMPKESRLGVHGWIPATIIEEEKTDKKGKVPLADRAFVEQVHRTTAAYLYYLERMGVDLRLASLTLRTPFSGISLLTPEDMSLRNVVTVDSRLSTIAGRRWPSLFLPEADETSAPSAEKSEVPPRKRKRASL
jgi:hypothetical protein